MNNMDCNNLSEETIYIDGVTFTSNMKKVVRVDRAIKKLSLPDSVEELEEELCYGHHNLKEVVIPPNVKVISRSCFSECDALKKVSFHEDSRLEEIDSYAFMGCISLDGISLPTSISVIGYMSFARCKNLEYMVIDDSVILLGNLAFEGCENLKKVIWLNSKCTSIGNYCFKDCKSIRSFEIIETMESIGVGAFEGCSSLEEFYCNSPHFVCSAGCLYSIDKYQDNKKTLVHKLFDTETLYLPENVELEISALAGNLRLTKVVVPEHVTSIPMRAFYECKNIESVELPDNLAYIGEEAFCYCESLESIAIPRSTESIGNGAFMFCKKLKSLTVPGNIKNIGFEVFAGCGISELMIEEGVETIGCCAFGWNKYLSNVCLPTSVKQIDNHAFLNCPMLEEIVIRENCKTIAKDAFDLCHNLKRIVIPKGSMSFYKKLIPGYSYLLIENPDEIISANDPITVICPKRKRLAHYDDLFHPGTIDRPHRNAVQKVIVPEGVETLGANLFKNCVSLAEVELPETLETIGNEVFSGCISLRKIKMPQSMKRIGRFAFAGCVDLHSFSVPEGIKRFPKYSRPFKGCASLEFVKLPASFMNWTDNIFEGCRSLSSISSAWFIANEGAIYTKDMKTLVSYTSGAKKFAVPEGVTVIGKDAFRESDIEEICFPPSLSTIMDFAFHECRKLFKVKFSSGLKRIGDFAFDSCVSLKTLDIPDGVTHLGSHAITIADSAVIRLPHTLKKWEDSPHGGNNGAVTRYIVPQDKVEYYQEFIARHIHLNQKQFVIETDTLSPQ